MAVRTSTTSGQCPSVNSSLSSNDFKLVLIPADSLEVIIHNTTTIRHFLVKTGSSASRFKERGTRRCIEEINTLAMYPHHFLGLPIVMLPR